MCIMLWFLCRKTFWRVLKKRSTEEFDSLPYVSTFLTASLWAYYGLIKPDGFLIVSVNIFGISLQVCYLTIFLLFSPPNMKVCRHSSTLDSCHFLFSLLLSLGFGLWNPSTRLLTPHLCTFWSLNFWNCIENSKLAC